MCSAQNLCRTVPFSPALETVVCLWAAAAGFLPRVCNLEEPLAADLPFVTEQTDWQGRRLACGLVENFGFGGQNAALVLRLWQEACA